MKDAFAKLVYCDSYTRMPSLIDLWFDRNLDRGRWFRELGESWQICDNTSAPRNRSFLRDVLQNAARLELDAMMTDAEYAEFARLPQMVTVFRGCYEFNRGGLSWSLNRAVAEKFPFFTRYAQHSRGFQPFLLTGRVSKARAVLKLARDEAEIIAPRVRVVAREELKKSGASR